MVQKDKAKEMSTPAIGRNKPCFDFLKQHGLKETNILDDKDFMRRYEIE